MYEQYMEDPEFVKLYQYLQDSGDIAPIQEYLQAQGELPEENMYNQNYNPLQQQLISKNLGKTRPVYPEGTDMFYEMQDPSLNVLENGYFNDILQDLY